MVVGVFVFRLGHMGGREFRVSRARRAGVI